MTPESVRRERHLTSMRDEVAAAFLDDHINELKYEIIAERGGQPYAQTPEQRPRLEEHHEIYLEGLSRKEARDFCTNESQDANGRGFDISRVMKQLVQATLHNRKGTPKGLTERELIQRESEIGRELFGPVEKGQRREFFSTDPQIWIWHEEWIDESNQPNQYTTKYEIRNDGVWKVQPGPRASLLAGDELKNFRQATKTYHERTMREMYKRDPQTGYELAA